MVYVWLTLLVIVNLCWLSLVFLSLPGNWLMVISTCLLAWWRWEDGVFSIYTLIAIAVLAFIGEMIEFFAGVGGARSAGAGWRGALGALAGAIIGAIAGTFLIPIPFLGTLTGACTGAGLGAWAMELTGGKKMKRALRTGVGAGVGVLFGTGSKIAIGALIWLIITITAFWP